MEWSVARQTVGIAAVRSPPEDHMDYYDPKHNLNCHRNGLVKMCTSFLRPQGLMAS